MTSFIRATLFAFLFLALASSTIASPSPIAISDLAAATNTDTLDERATLVSGVESVLQSDGLEKRGRKHRHRKPKRKSHKKKPSKGNNGNINSSTGTKHSGDATFYSVGMGACGKTNSDNEMVAAASHELYDSFPGATANPNNNPICGRRLRATYKGRSVVVKIVDRCEGCSKWALDFSPRAFNQMGKPSDGRLHGMQWQWI